MDKKLNIIILSSVLNKENGLDIENRTSLREIKYLFDISNIVGHNSVDSYDKEAFTVVFVATGGSEEQFMRIKDKLPKPIVIVSDSYHNSLPASLEISTWLKRGSIPFEHINIPSEPSSKFREELRESIEELYEVQLALERIKGKRILLIGKESPWLIASSINTKELEQRFGVTFIDVPATHLLEKYSGTTRDDKGCIEIFKAIKASKESTISDDSLWDAIRVYKSLQSICIDNRADALTIRCFDLLETCHTTACLALALLNDNGIVAGCEGDIPSLWSMTLAREVCKSESFMANPSSIDYLDNSADFAHCTAPLRIGNSFKLTTHYESGIGVGIASKMSLGKYTLLKCGGENLEQYFSTEGEVVQNTCVKERCRTQVKFIFKSQDKLKSFLTSYLGNHIVLIPGKHKDKIKQFMKYLATLLAFFTLSTATLSAQNIKVRDQFIQESVEELSSKNMRESIEALVACHTRHNMSKTNSSKEGIGAAATVIEERLKKQGVQSGGFFTVERFSYKAGGKGSRIPTERTLTNIVATIKGSREDDNRVIVLLAHYDSRVGDNSDSTTFAPGANDNGSGVAALLEISRILSHKRLPLTVKIMFLSGEEHGLLGAAHMAAVAKSEKWNIAAVLNNDMISNSLSSETGIRNNSIVRVFSENIPFVESQDEQRSRVFNSSENDSESRQLARYIKEIGERYVSNLEVKLIYRNDRFGRGGDHTPFSRNGFTAVRICEYYENYHRTHQKVGTVNGIEFGDVIAGVDFEYLLKNTALNLSVIMNMALAPAPPQDVKTDVSSLSNKTEIKWSAPNVGPKPEGYYLLIRETDQSMWQQKIFVKGESIEVPISKDNFFFAVQSVGTNGNESVAIFSTGSR